MTLENLLALQALLVALDEEETAETYATYHGDTTLQEEETQSVAETVWG